MGLVRFGADLLGRQRTTSRGLIFSFAWIEESLPLDIAVHYISATFPFIALPSLPRLPLGTRGMELPLTTAPLGSCAWHLAPSFCFHSFTRAVAYFCWGFLHLPYRLNFGCLIINICQVRGTFCYAPAMDTVAHIWPFRNSDRQAETFAFLFICGRYTVGSAETSGGFFLWKH